MRYKIIITPDEYNEAFRLRHEIYVEKLHWVEGANGLEIDAYDLRALPLGDTKTGN